MQRRRAPSRLRGTARVERQSHSVEAPHAHAARTHRLAATESSATQPRTRSGVSSRALGACAARDAPRGCPVPEASGCCPGWRGRWAPGRLVAPRSPPRACATRERAHSECTTAAWHALLHHRTGVHMLRFELVVEAYGARARLRLAHCQHRARRAGVRCRTSASQIWAGTFFRLSASTGCVGSHGGHHLGARRKTPKAAAPGLVPLKTYGAVPVAAA